MADKSALGAVITSPPERVRPLRVVAPIHDTPDISLMSIIYSTLLLEQRYQAGEPVTEDHHTAICRPGTLITLILLHISGDSGGFHLA
jgi:hypothetical protein